MKKFHLLCDLTYLQIIFRPCKALRAIRNQSIAAMKNYSIQYDFLILETAISGKMKMHVNKTCPDSCSYRVRLFSGDDSLFFPQLNIHIKHRIRRLNFYLYAVPAFLVSPEPVLSLSHGIHSPYPVPHHDR